MLRLNLQLSDPLDTAASRPTRGTRNFPSDRPLSSPRSGAYRGARPPSDEREVSARVRTPAPPSKTSLATTATAGKRSGIRAFMNVSIRVSSTPIRLGLVVATAASIATSAAPADLQRLIVDGQLTAPG